MKNPMLVRFGNIPLYWRLRLMTGLLFLGVLVFLSVYWMRIEASNAQLRQETLVLADQHAEQLADAVAHQAEDFFHGIDTGLRHMRHDYREDKKSFLESVRATLDGYPEGVILNISVFDSSGEAVYNMVPATGRVFGTDRDYFRDHAQRPEDRLSVSPAILTRISKVWGIPVSRKLTAEGPFSGVIVIFIRADYLNRMLTRISRHDTDVISLFTQDGGYLSRSSDLENAMGKKVPRDRPFIGPDAPRSGVFRAVAAYDNVPRVYGWFRLDSLPLVVNVGLDSRPVLAPVEARIDRGRRANLIGSGLVVVGVLVIAGLLLRMSAQQKKMEDDDFALQINKIAFDSASDGIMVTDGDNRILLVNPALVRLTGYDVDELVGQSPSLLSSGVHGKEFFAALWDGLQTTGRWEGEVTNRHKDGHLYIEWLKINVIHKDDPVRRRHVAIFSDITQRKATEEALAQQRAELQRSNLELERFGYVASHDLREPLRMVSSYLSLIERRYNAVLDDEGREFIAFAKDGAKRMDRLIRDLLDYSRLGRGGEPPVAIDLGEVTREALANLAVAIEGASGRVELQPSMPPVLGNRGELVRLMQNLVGNAIKYRAPDRAPLVTITGRPCGTMWEVTVADNGMGIAEGDIGRIFGIFQRLHGREIEGTGIGLASCKKIVEQHGGTIKVTSVPGEGSAFCFTLPRAEPNLL